MFSIEILQERMVSGLTRNIDRSSVRDTKWTDEVN